MRTIKFRFYSEDATPRYLSFDVPDDASQLIGFDPNGEEIYSGDVLTYTQDWRPASAALAIVFVDNLGQTFYPPNNDFHWIF